MNCQISALKNVLIAMGAALAISSAPLAAQEIESFDPDAAFTGGIDADLAPADQASPDQAPAQTTTADNSVTYSPAPAGEVAAEWSDPAPAASATTSETATASDSATYGEDDLIGAAEGVFGKAWPG